MLYGLSDGSDNNYNLASWCDRYIDPLDVFNGSFFRISSVSQPDLALRYQSRKDYRQDLFGNRDRIFHYSDLFTPYTLDIEAVSFLHLPEFSRLFFLPEDEKDKTGLRPMRI